ncbi:MULTISPECIES: DUF2388 domain-containing protein [unclassified Pseudomonas]|uniref:DUF2388 domain-containing protein n=1 Tax=unclassified Pseudomonas TaxID=196821 RepID=UPI002096BFE7|nr:MULTISPECIES: DUF2388 domain-containing protein [unclassified Pseudomonas]MCO7521698.1 DUF2388 domain-containing protein [Pseudomonas sp. 1]MCO7542183.1 DUF2388 domain-containing protein [Pseudomonas sp. VA159-2]
MRLLYPFALGTCLAVSQAQATSFVMTTDMTVSLSMSASKGTSSSFKDDKIVLAAKDDAAAFVASSGAIRGARMEAAFARIRQVLDEPGLPDEALARAILAL